MNENNATEKIIYHFNGFDDSWFFGSKWITFIVELLISLGNGFITSVLLTVILFSFFKFPEFLIFVGAIIFGLFYFYLLWRSRLEKKSSYKIYENRIEFFNERNPAVKDRIDLREIDQVRFEDDFGKSYSSSVPNQPFIYCYFINGYKSKSKKIKKDRLKLLLGEKYDKEESVILILQFFKEKKKQVYISTRHEEINKALNLKNWTDPGIHPSIRL